MQNIAVHTIDGKVTEYSKDVLINIKLENGLFLISYRRSGLDPRECLDLYPAVNVIKITHEQTSLPPI